MQAMAVCGLNSLDATSDSTKRAQSPEIRAAQITQCTQLDPKDCYVGMLVFFTGQFLNESSGFGVL